MIQPIFFEYSDNQLTDEVPPVMYPAGITSTISISPAEPIIIAADSQIQFSATMTDSNGDLVSGNPMWWTSGGSIDAGGLYTPQLVGNWTVSAESDGVNESVSITVIAGQPTQLFVTPELATITVDETLQLESQIVDVKGNNVSGEIVSWTVSNGTLNESNVYHPWNIGVQTIDAWWNGQSITITITVNPGSATTLEIPYGMTALTGVPFMITPNCFDSRGNSLPLSAAGTLIWDIEHGFLNEAERNYTASTVGIWNITVNSTSGAFGTGQIEVVSSTPVSITLIGPEDPVPADKAVELTVMGNDAYGNTNPVQVPLSSWTASNGHFINGVNGTEWLPSNEGTWMITVTIGQMTSSIEIEVIHGGINYVRIESDDNRISSDETLLLSFMAVDSRGNTWAIQGNWSMENTQAVDWLIESGETAIFSPGTSSLGNWVIIAEWFSPEDNELFSATIEVEVVAGQLSYILLDGHGQTINSDEQLDINPRGFDIDGNLIPGISLNWSINGIDATAEMRLQNGVFFPSELGQHEIRAWGSYGTPGSITLEVTHGEIYSLSTGLLNPFDTKIFSGESMTLLVTAQDRAGNSFQTDVNWTYDYEFGSIETSSGSIGEYELIAEKLGTYSLEFSANGIKSNVSITVLEGLPYSLDLKLVENEGKQGETLELFVKILDEGGNELTLDPSKLTLSATSGEVTKDGESWFVELDEAGLQHSISAGYEGVENPAKVFFDVESVLFSGKVGSTEDVMMYGILLMVMVIVGLGIILTIKRKNEGEYDWNDEFVEEPEMYEEKLDVFEEKEYSEPEPEPETTKSLLTAMDGTVQGQTGWYQGLDGGSEYWEVTPDGQWIRVR